MPRVPKEWLNTVVYLYPSPQAARDGDRAGGTGFIVSTPVEDESLAATGRREHLTIITNAHIIHSGASPVVRINRYDGTFEVIPLAADDWTDHPDGDDLSAVPLPNTPGVINMYVERKMVLTEAEAAHWDFGPGDDIFFIGRYVDLEGKEHNIPVVRSGIVSAMPAEPIEQTDRGFMQESILVEARSLSGFSGSPVFIYTSSYIHAPDNREHFAGNRVQMTPLSPCFLLGVDWGHHHWREKVRDGYTGEPVDSADFIPSNSGMMMVVPAWKILDLLDLPEFVQRRRDIEGISLAILGIDRREERPPGDMTFATPS